MEYPFIMAEVNKAILQQRKDENFPIGLSGQMLKIMVNTGFLAIEANAKKYGKQENQETLRIAAIDLMATLFIFIHEIEKQTK